MNYLTTKPLSFPKPRRLKKSWVIESYDKGDIDPLYDDECFEKPVKKKRRMKVLKTKIKPTYRSSKEDLEVRSIFL